VRLQFFKENKLSKISSEREVEFYVNNFEGYPKVPEYINREAILVSLQSLKTTSESKLKYGDLFKMNSR
jgi:hypothetical protein